MNADVIPHSGDVSFFIWRAFQAPPQVVCLQRENEKYGGFCQDFI
jgi:hypothetical protein